MSTHMVHIIAPTVALLTATVGLMLFGRAVAHIVRVITTGQPLARTDRPGQRTLTMLKETLGHTRMLKWRWVGIGHWFVFTGFGLLFFTLITAFGQLFDSHWMIPWLGEWVPFAWASEILTAAMLVAICAFIVYRLTRPTQRTRGPRGRFFGSTMWWGYFVEFVIVGVGVCIAVLRALEYAQYAVTGGHEGHRASWVHFPLSHVLGRLFVGATPDALAAWICAIAALKIVISFAWMITISLNSNMGTAWHRFTAFFNIWFRRDPTGRPALGAVKPLTSGGKPITLDTIDPEQDTTFGVGAIQDFAWKGILDFTTCTECGRCQSQCPAWNTGKPLSPKLLITALRDAAHGKAPYLLNSVEHPPLVGKVGDGEPAYNPESGSAVVDEDVLWSCTTCGACVEQCPVDIEHIDHIVDMRRYQVLTESTFPAELNPLFRGLETKGNPWNLPASTRMDWAKDLPFDVKVVGQTIASLDEVDWLFWVGCAGAFDDRAKKTTCAVAELLHIAGVSFGVLGNGETCTGDPARRAGNEFVFQELAQQNVQTFREYRVKKVVATCAHCFNTLKNEYKEFGIELDVVHHTQLLNRLVREGNLTPVAPIDRDPTRSITYHDPCYLGRHNGVYSPPRELLGSLGHAELVEMPRNSERSFCCGAGGARMWMDDTLGERINLNRTTEAVQTGADQIAVGCPFCRVMLSDGLTTLQASGNAGPQLEVIDVAQMLLAAVKPTVASEKTGSATPLQASPAAAQSDEGSKSTGHPPVDTTQPSSIAAQTTGVSAAPPATADGPSLFDAAAAPAGGLFGEPTPTVAAPESLFGPPMVPADGVASADVAGVSNIPAARSLFDTTDDTTGVSVDHPMPGADAAQSLFGTPPAADDPMATGDAGSEQEHAHNAAHISDMPSSPAPPGPNPPPATQSLFDVSDKQDE